MGIAGGSTLVGAVVSAAGWRAALVVGSAIGAAGGTRGGRASFDAYRLGHLNGASPTGQPASVRGTCYGRARRLAASPMPPVPIPPRPERPPATPEELYDRLTVTDSAIGALWRHQSHMLGRYYGDHRASADVALELPTGAGKTLVGLLIADWRRQTEQRPAAFLCPTRQLARQAYDKALGYGIRAVLLTGSNLDWDPAEKTLGLSGGATIISVYSHIFNTSPKLQPDTLVLDDAHAAESYVAQNWSLSISRSHPGYGPLLEAVDDLLDPGVLAGLRDDALGRHARPVPAFVGPADMAALSPRLLESLDAAVGPNDRLRFPLGELRAHLAGCVLYAGWSEILLRPFVPPTRFHPAFQDAGQRVYLSATMGAAGELERSFGRTTVPRVAMPADWERHGSGRRLVLMPGAGMGGGDATEFVRTTIEALPRSLALVPSDAQVDDVRPLLPDGWTVLTKDDVDDRLQPFRSEEGCTLVLANRYDGIDLPGDACRLILISGLPAGTHLQERFLFETADARSALRERMRTRLMQGMGRATRSRSDRAVVLLTGEDLLLFINDPGNIAGMRAELQAEIAYGLYLATQGASLSDAVQSFYEGGDDWAGAEAYLRQEAENADLEPPAGMQALQDAAPEEVLACEAAWRGEPGWAAHHAQAAVRRLTTQAVGGYRTLWKVLAAHWAAQHAAVTRDPLDARVAAELGRDAAASARVRAWRPRLPQVDVDADVQALDTRAVRIAERLLPISRSPKVDRYLDEAQRWIDEAQYASFERGLLRLGELLGFDAVRPGAPASPDGAWRDGDDQLLWEAKSEQLAGGAVSAKIVRQATTHPTWVVRELDWQSDGNAITYLVTPRTEVDPEAVAVAGEHVQLCGLDAVRALTRDAVSLWRDVVGRVQGLAPAEVAELICRELLRRGLATADLSSRLGAQPVAEMTAAREADPAQP